MSTPRPLTVILDCHNAGSRLQPALESIWTQRWLQPEIIAVDCGSTDGSTGILEENRGKFAHLLIRSHGDRYGALNEALAVATGDWILFLRGRDRLVGDMILSETLNWMKKTEAGVVAGESAADDGRIEKLHSRINALARNFTPRSATFYRRRLFTENGSFDPLLEAMADYEFNVRLWKSHVRFKPIPLRIAACAADRLEYDWRTCREEIRVRHHYFSVGRCGWWDAMSLLRWAVAKVTQPFLRSR